MAIDNARVIYNFNDADELLRTRVTTLEEALGGIDLGSLDEKIEAEKAARETADTELGERITGVETGYATADATLKAQVEAGYAAADGVVKAEMQTALDNEKAALLSALDTEKTVRETADNNVKAEALAAVDVEAVNREAGDTALQTAIDDEVTARQSMGTILNRKLAEEATARQTGDDLVQGNIEAEATARQAADAELTSAIDTEVADRQAAITNEVTNRNNAITSAIAEYNEQNQARLDSLQNQIDGAVTTWFGDVPPDLENYPAQDWTDDATKNVHLGDIYYDNRTGYAYRFKLADEVYGWTMIQDSDITVAIAKAEQAQATADTKLDANLGAVNASHLLAVDEDGNVTANPPKGLLITSETGLKTYFLSITDNGQLQLAEII